MNKLVIDRKKFDEEVWQYKTDFTAEQYNTWLSGAIDNLQLIYDTYDVTGVVGKDCGDVYVLGDIINMLANTKIVIGRK